MVVAREKPRLKSKEKDCVMSPRRAAVSQEERIAYSSQVPKANFFQCRMIDAEEDSVSVFEKRCLIGGCERTQQSGG